MNPPRIRGSWNSKNRKDCTVHIHFGYGNLRPKILSGLSIITQLISLKSFEFQCSMLPFKLYHSIFSNPKFLCSKTCLVLSKIRKLVTLLLVFLCSLNKLPVFTRIPIFRRYLTLLNAFSLHMTTFLVSRTLQLF